VSHLTWADISKKLRRFISDIKGTEQKARIDEESLLDFWISGQDDLVTYVARSGKLELQPQLITFELPDDLYRVSAVRSQQGHTILPLDAHPENTEEQVWDGVFWMLQDQWLSFTQPLDQLAWVYYQKYYPAPDQNDSIILIPRWAIQPLTYYVGALTVEQQSIADTQLRRWATKSDSGTPITNPFIPVAEYLMARYREMMLVKVGDTAAGRRTWPTLYR